MGAQAHEDSSCHSKKKDDVALSEKVLWDTKDLVAATGLSASTITRFRDRGEFPKPVALGVNRVMWRADDIRAWVAARAA